MDFQKIASINMYLLAIPETIRINKNFSSSKVVSVGIPQGSIDEPLLFNLFAIFYIISDRNVIK